MPSYDVSRSRFRLSDEHVHVLVRLATGEPLPEEFFAPRDELRACGLINQTGQLVSALVPLIDTLLAPVVVISLETASRQGELHHGVLIGENDVISHQAWPGTSEAEYARVAPKMLVWALADMVNLQQPIDVDGKGVSLLETTMGTVESGLAALEAAPFTESDGEDRHHIRKALAAVGTLDEPALSLLTNMLAELRSSWRMTAAWQGHKEHQEGVEARGFAVWDCGPLGYWHRERPAEPVSAGRIGPESPLRFVRADAKKIWELITGLLPADDEIGHPG
ncbi:histidine kinase [Streptomyces sp. NPDC006923]|uniref:histidine kinase n=1 Tax=Streptomyces sp. NPDC006923 TaxID=3155355 RepID=UPI0034084973